MKMNPTREKRPPVKWKQASSHPILPDGQRQHQGQSRPLDAIDFGLPVMSIGGNPRHRARARVHITETPPDQ
ncbi:hypothetical protein QR685DRAFT_575866 [Neurospora intermedia]|uniref:Uncharacterized protein n=1 Tax=Neurospora intermedia TaxID=5142 RepID=A0ABR3CZD1_NEUIN